VVVSPSAVVWNQAGAAIGDLVRARLPDTQVIDIPLDPPEPPDPRAEILLAWPRRDLPAAAREGVDVDWAHDVRWIHSAMTGIDDYPSALLRERVVTCSRGLAAVPAAEYVLAAILSAEKHIPEIWQQDSAATARSGTLAGKTLGIVGLGEIGTAVAERALAFGMHVVATRRTDRPSPTAGVTLISLDELLTESHHIALTLPATPATRHCIDASAVARMRPGSHIINVARGSLIDDQALLAALDEGRIGLATLDVTDPEPLPANHQLRRHPRVRLSPHVSARDPHGLERLVDRFVTNYRRYTTGDELLGLVDLAAGY
jgi:phosphoglycerate dehydrogenase-like enzyme